MGLPTLFPPVPKTVWRPGDPDIVCLEGTLIGPSLFIQNARGLVMRGPGISLDAGLYGVEFELAPGAAGLRADVRIAEVQVTGGSGSLLFASRTVTAGELYADFGGMYKGIRLDVILEQRIADVEFRVVGAGDFSFQVFSVKLVPRPGRAWFAAEMDYDPPDWEAADDLSATNSEPGLIVARGITLDAGDHRLGVKLRPPDGMTSGDIAAIRVIGRPVAGGDAQIIAADPHVTAEAMLANLGIPDAKLRFRLAGAYREVAIEVEALVPGLTLQWIRLATADEAVWHHYWNLGGKHSSLRRPMTAFTVAETAPGRLCGAYRLFEHGAIYWTVEHGPCEVTGAILAQYEAADDHVGALGLPVSRPKQTGEIVVQHFEGGKLTSGG